MAWWGSWKISQSQRVAVGPSRGHPVPLPTAAVIKACFVLRVTAVHSVQMRDFRMGGMGGAESEASNQFTWISEMDGSRGPGQCRAVVKEAGSAGLNLVSDALAATLCMWRALHSIVGDPAEARQPDDARSAPRLTESVHHRRGREKELGPLPRQSCHCSSWRAKAHDDTEALALQRHLPEGPELRSESQAATTTTGSPRPCNNNTERQHNQPSWWSNNMSSTGSTAS
jgi:hypothetical protein